MARGKSKNAKTWEKILMVLVNGGEVKKEQIESTIGYEHMYRISTELWKIKTRGGVIRTVKDGRKVVGYELVNLKDMKKLLDDRGFSAIPIAKKSKKKVEKLQDLQTEVVESVSADVATAEVDVVEVTEVTE
jgi:hypothetical protein